MGYVSTLMIFKSHHREMVKRKLHNRKIIMDFEIKRTNDLLSNLVPPTVLQGIKNDQKVVDELEDVTLLFTDMVGFTQFSNNVKNPKEVVKLLSELFCRFD
jgi:class 3 adenylate cyclase